MLAVRHVTLRVASMACSMWLGSAGFLGKAVPAWHRGTLCLRRSQHSLEVDVISALGLVTGSHGTDSDLAGAFHHNEVCAGHFTP
eukprot:5891468-Amphidinium_carterae.1